MGGDVVGQKGCEIRSCDLHRPGLSQLLQVHVLDQESLRTELLEASSKC